MRLRRTARAHLDERANAFQDSGKASRVDVPLLVHQLGEYPRLAARVLQPFGGIVQQRLRIGVRVGEVSGVAVNPGFAEDVHA